MQEIEKKIYEALRKGEVAFGIGSTATANEIIKAVKPFYQNGTEEEKGYIVKRLEGLKKEPGIGLPLNYSELLNK